VKFPITTEACRKVGGHDRPELLSQNSICKLAHKCITSNSACVLCQQSPPWQLPWPLPGTLPLATLPPKQHFDCNFPLWAPHSPTLANLTPLSSLHPTDAWLSPHQYRITPAAPLPPQTPTCGRCAAANPTIPRLPSLLTTTACHHRPTNATSKSTPTQARRN